MALGGSSRMSRKSDLITRINLERNHQGMPLDSVLALNKSLWRQKVEVLKVIYNELLSRRK